LKDRSKTMTDTTERKGPEAVPAQRRERLDSLKRVVVGRPRASSELHETLLSKTLALPIFASDPLSSVAYATEAALAVLIAASAGAGHLVLPVSIAIAAVLGIVVLSYTQTVTAYATSGGAYVVARENLGTLPSLVAAAALLVDYILTVAVSVTAGVLALTSAAPSLASHRVSLSLVFVVLLTLVNLRGVRESGILFALPTYAFVVVMFTMIGTGVGKCAAGACPEAHVTHPIAAGAGTVGALVVLRAFSSGALTSIPSLLRDHAAARCCSAGGIFRECAGDSGRAGEIDALRDAAAARAAEQPCAVAHTHRVRGGIERRVLRQYHFRLRSPLLAGLFACRFRVSDRLRQLLCRGQLPCAGCKNYRHDDQRRPLCSFHYLSP
jgi:hypothetical protein